MTEDTRVYQKINRIVGIEADRMESLIGPHELAAHWKVCADELMVDAKSIEYAMRDAWASLRMNDGEQFESIAHTLSFAARHAACEAVMLAAIAEKMLQEKEAEREAKREKRVNTMDGVPSFIKSFEFTIKED